MTTRVLLHYPDPRLRNKAFPVEKIDDEIRELIQDMFETMYADDGVGLAATQINVAKRVIVVDPSDNRSEPLCLINPEILETEGKSLSSEGCLSVPGFYEKVERAEKITVKALDKEGKPIEITTGGLLAICIQHEIDHLNGKLFIDYLSPLKRQLFLKKYQKLRKRTL